MLMWTNFGSFAITDLIEVVPNSLQTQKSLELVFRPQFL